MDKKRIEEKNKELTKVFGEIDRESIVILKGHLSLEESLDFIIENVVHHSDFMNKAKLTFYQKLNVARAMSLTEQNNSMWTLIEKINTLRNDFSHRLESDKREEKIKVIISLYKSEMNGSEFEHDWEKEHVKDKPFVIAIADFHDTMSMTWSYNALLDYLYGYRYEHSFDVNGKIIVKPIKIGNYIKLNGTEIHSGFFFQAESENVSAIIFSSCGTLSKFNRMGKQAELGSIIPTLIRMGTFYNHEPNAVKPNIVSYEVNKESNETWSEGVVVFHNPNALIPLNPDFFDDRVAQSFFEDELIYSHMPKIFPYNSFTQNIIPIDENNGI